MTEPVLENRMTPELERLLTIFEQSHINMLREHTTE